MDNLQDYLKIKDAATFLGVSESTLRNWERKGIIRAVRNPVNGYRLFLRSDLSGLLEKVGKRGEQPADSLQDGFDKDDEWREESLPVLDSLIVINFRTFEHLAVERLGRVNLIVGKNNVGKSSLLEAIRLYAAAGNLTVIESILRARDEALPVAGDVANYDEPRPLQVERLMHQSHRFDENAEAIVVGPLGENRKRLSLGLELRQAGRSQPPTASDGTAETAADEPQAMLVIRMGDMQVGAYRRAVLEDPEYWRFIRRRPRAPVEGITCCYLTARETDLEQLASWWDSIALTDAEEDVLAGLRLLDPNVERLQFVQRTRRSRTPVVKVRGSEGPVPLASMGDGMNRVLAILLALVSARGGICLIDEVENGIHYSVQKDLWRLILGVAERTKVQVFATTHSWDCIQAFQEATSAVPGQQGYLIRLSRRDQKVVATVFDERKIGIATRQEIEVR